MYNRFSNVFGSVMPEPCQQFRSTGILSSFFIAVWLGRAVASSIGLFSKMEQRNCIKLLIKNKAHSSHCLGLTLVHEETTLERINKTSKEAQRVDKKKICGSAT